MHGECMDKNSKVFPFQKLLIFSYHHEVISAILLCYQELVSFHKDYKNKTWINIKTIRRNPNTWKLI